MKTKEIKANSDKKGISLIMLVITIIVIIILAVAVILSIANNNPIENAKKAKEANNNAVEKEKIELLKQAKLMKQSLGTKTEDEVNEEIIKANYPDLNYEEDFKNSRGKKVYVGEDEKIKEELQKGLGVLTVKKDILEYVNQITDTSLIVNDCYLTGLVKTPNDINGMYTVETLLAKLPEGSKILAEQSDGSFKDANSTQVVSTGFKIQDKDGNDMLYTVFFGDLSGEGYVNSLDYVIMKKIILTFKENHSYYNIKYYRYACDVNGDGKMSEEDLNTIMKCLEAGQTPPYVWDGGDDSNLNQFRPVTNGLKIE